MAIKAIPYRPRNIARSLETKLAGVMVWISGRYADDFGRTVSTWSHVVVFFLRKLGQWAIVYGTDDEIYFYVSGGTRPHAILPRRAKRLAFQTGYRAKTNAGRLAAIPGGSFGPVVHAKAVQHPGTLAREFPKFVVGKWHVEFPRRAQEAINAAIQQAYSH